MKAGVKHPLPAIMFDLGRTFLTAVERRPDAMSVADELQLLSYAGWYAEIARVGWSAMPSRRSAWASNMTPPSEVIRPPSNAAVIFLRSTAGNENGSRLSSIMAGVAASNAEMEWLRHPIPTPSQALTLHPPIF